MSSVSEAVWQGKKGGLEGQLEQADKLEQQGDAFGAHCLRASAYYSRRKLMQAKYWAQRAIDLMAPRTGGPQPTHGQCDVLATVLLRRWLWMKADPHAAAQLFQMGLARFDVPAHSRALMEIGLAEVYLLLGQRGTCTPHIDTALSEAQPERYGSTDLVQHQRQCCRVWHRAAVLMHKLGKHQVAKTYWDRALNDASHPTWGAAGQVKKIKRERFITKYLWWLQRLRLLPS